MKRRTAALVVALAASAASADLVADQTPFHTYRGLWMDRFDYSNESQIRTAFARAQSLGITDMMFQVRGQADAFYNNTDGVEVRANGVSASYDPLAIAVEEGHARGIKVHAWINTMPIWRGSSPPTNPQHLYNTNPEFIIADSAGNPRPLDGGYNIVNPARPDVRAHIANVARTIVKNYNVDGLHLDYIRLIDANPGSTNVLEYPADPYTVSLFQQEFPGQTPTANVANFRQWVADQITALVSDVRQAVKSERPGTQLTAAVWRDSGIGLNDYQQDWQKWVEMDLLDAAIPMIYTQSSSFYYSNVTSGLSKNGNSAVIIGLGNYLQTNAATAYDNMIAQLNWARDEGANGIQLFDYGTLFDGSAASNEVRRALTDFFAAHSSAAPKITLADFEVGEGTFNRPPTFSGSNRFVASGTADRVTDEAHTGTASQRLVINKSAGADSFLFRHTSGDGNPANNVELTSIGSVSLWLKTSTPDLQVAVGVDDPSTGDRSYFQNVIDNGQWHRYEWFLNDVTHWDPWPGVGGDGKIATRFSIDSIFFTGSAATSEFFFDDFEFDPAAVAPDQWTLNADGSWHNDANWTGGVPDAVGASANLLRRATASRTISLDSDVTLGSLTLNNSAGYTLAGPGTLTFDAATGPAELRIVNRGSHTLAVSTTLIDDLDLFIDRGSTLSISGDGEIDIGLHHLVIDYVGDSLLTTARNWRDTGRLYSNAATPDTALVLLESSLVGQTTFGSIAVDETAVLALLTLKGDTNLDRTVDFTDLLNLARAFNSAGTWLDGDSDGNGVVDFTDLLAVAKNFNAALLTDGTVRPGDAGDFESTWALAGSLVPEPATLAAAGSIGLLALRRRRDVTSRTSARR